MKLGTLVEDPYRIIFRLGPNSDICPLLVVAILNFNMTAIFDIILPMPVTLKLRQTKMWFQCIYPQFRGQGIQKKSLKKQTKTNKQTSAN